MISIPLDTMSLAEKLEAMEALLAAVSPTTVQVPGPEWLREATRARLASPAK